LAVQALKGFKDILPEEVGTWQHIEEVARVIFHRFGFTEIKVPILEKTELFVRSIGEATDIVEKEMYTFTDRNGSMVTMRPEGTASVLRAFVEHGLHVSKPLQKLYTIGPMFRHERPQKGRLRQFHQLSVEALGSDNPRLDAEIMAMAWLVLKELGVEASLEVNSLGCPQCRPLYKEKLVSFLEQFKGQVCEDCERRRETNPLRVLDCKSDNCKAKYVNAPSILDSLCADCQIHFDNMRQGLELLSIPYTVNPFMVRGLDYYTRTTFELVTGALGAQSAVGAGGRYDGLIEQLGGPKLPGIGFAIGMERLVLLLQQTGNELPVADIDFFIATLGEVPAEKGFQLLHQLRMRGKRAAMDLEGRSLKSQMKQAAKAQARFTLILGEEELARKEGVLRNMADGTQQSMPLAGEIADWCDTLLKLLDSD